MKRMMRVFSKDTVFETSPRTVGNSRINLMHVVLDMDIGGLQRLITQMTLAMDHKLFNVEIVCMNREGCFADTLRSHGIQVTLLQRNQRRADIWYPFRLAAFLRSKKIHVLHMHAGVFIFGALAGKMALTPCTVYTEHGRAVVDHPLLTVEDRLAVKLVDRVATVSPNLNDILVERIKVPRKKLVTIINGIATDLFARRPRPAALVKEFAIPDNCKIIGTVARLDGIKDQLTMIQAFEAIGDRLGDCRLFLVGDGPLHDELTAYINQQNLQGHVIITGRRNDVADFLNLFDIFVLSSLSEGTSMSLLEAMASGVPPVVTRVGGNPDIVEHGTDGLIVEPRDPASLADAIVRLLSDRELHRQFSDRCIAKVERDYSIERMARSYCQTYIEILHGKKRFRDVSI
jgi:glycosyltransferase involved in cell wall biosynthesis